MNSILLQSDPGLFIGRFHPLIVHLPIGFLLLAIVFYFLSFSAYFNSLKNSIPYILFFGTISALLSVIVGWLLASKGGYNEDVLSWHKWLAIALVIISFALWAWSVWGNKNKRITTSLMVTVLILISVTGHLGGTLTHGDRYMFEYAPDFIRDQFLVNNGIGFNTLSQDSDSIFLYADLIRPVFDQKCISCHNGENKSGGLDMTHLDSLLQGGDNGQVLIEGNALQSELFKRVTMDPNDRKYMPPNGTPLSYTEILLIQEWILKGLDTAQVISDEGLSSEVKIQLEASYGLDTRRKSFVEKLKLEPMDDALVKELQDHGFLVKQLTKDLNLLDLKYADSISVDKLKLLNAFEEHIVWLDLSGAMMEDSLLIHLANFENLVRLDLHNNPITNVAFLSPLQHLEVLNLHTTQIGDANIGVVEKMKSLKSLYLWQSAVTAAKVDSLRTDLPHLEVNFGSKLEVVVAEEEAKDK
jgi:uncharacterized membrane protein